MLHSTTQRVDRSDLIKHHLQGHSRPRQANVTSPWKQSPTRSRWTETRRDGTPRQTNRTEPKQRRLEKQSSPTRSEQTDGHGQVNTDRSTRTGNMQLYHNTGAVQRYEDAHLSDRIHILGLLSNFRGDEGQNHDLETNSEGPGSSPSPWFSPPQANFSNNHRKVGACFF